MSTSSQRPAGRASPASSLLADAVEPGRHHLARPADRRPVAARRRPRDQARRAGVRACP
nr:hypothetical protein [Angustibacter aerolatus]